MSPFATTVLCSGFDGSGIAPWGDYVSALFGVYPVRAEVDEGGDGSLWWSLEWWTLRMVDFVVGLVVALYGWCVHISQDLDDLSVLWR